MKYCYAEKNQSRYQTYMNVRTTLSKRSKYLAVKTKSETAVINYLATADMGFTTSIQFEPANSKLRQLFDKDCLGKSKTGVTIDVW